MEWQDLLNAMRAAAGEDDDQESAHIEADELLVSVIERLLMERPEAEQGALRALLDTYGRVPKWYA